MNLEQKRINDILRLIEHPHNHINCIRLHKSTSVAHMNRICEICIEALIRDLSFVTEAKFINSKGRADIVLLDLGIAVEVTDTEADESIVKKSEKYPLDIIKISAHEPFTWKMLE